MSEAAPEVIGQADDDDDGESLELDEDEGRGQNRRIRVRLGRGRSGGSVSTPLGDAPVVPLLLVGFGAYLIWFGIKYWRGAGPAVWPSYPIKSVLQGKGVPPNETATTATAVLTAYEQSLSQQVKQQQHQAQTSPGGPPPTGPEPGGAPQHIARLLLSRYGWAASQMPPLILLWTRESNWNPNARNTTSGAYGIAQALGHGGAGTAAANGTNEYGAEYGLTDAEARAANSGVALWQIRWGLGYIKSVYGSPAAAWAHEVQFGWY
ncbi:MAG TPA: hypothetical protein VGV89_07215 [Thermoplasmata archaeon]|nr:hypothetical protein [Thermoplasmata archaeon]